MSGHDHKGVSTNYFTIDHPVSLHNRKRVRNDGADSTPSTSASSMQHPTEDDESPDLNCDLNRKVKMRRKAAKQTPPFPVTMEELHLIQKLRLHFLVQGRSKLHDERIESHDCRVR
jgi:hypothetical protein